MECKISAKHNVIFTLHWIQTLALTCLIMYKISELKSYITCSMQSKTFFLSLVVFLLALCDELRAYSSSVEAKQSLG